MYSLIFAVTQQRHSSLNEQWAVTNLKQNISEVFLINNFPEDLPFWFTTDFPFYDSLRLLKALKIKATWIVGNT